MTDDAEQLELDLAPVRPTEEELHGVLPRLPVALDDPGAWPRLGRVPDPPSCDCPDPDPIERKCLTCGTQTTSVQCDPCKIATVKTAAAAASR